MHTRVVLLLAVAVTVLCLAGYRFLGRELPSTVNPEGDRVPGAPPPPRLALQASSGAEQVESEPAEEEPAPPVHILPANRLVDLALNSSSAFTRADVLEELAARRITNAVPILLDRLSDPDDSVRRVAADGLAELGNPVALTGLGHALLMENVERTRLAMAQAIAELRP